MMFKTFYTLVLRKCLMRGCQIKELPKWYLLLSMEKCLLGFEIGMIHNGP